MIKLRFHFNPISTMRIIHAGVGVLLIAALITLGVKLYDEFYLPYNLQDAPITSATLVQDDPNAQLILQTVNLLEQRHVTSTTPIVPNIFWPLTSSSTRKEL